MNFLTMMYLLRKKQDLTFWRICAFDSFIQPLEFYALLEAAVRQHQTPDLEVSHKEYTEGHVLSDKRVFLRLRRGQLAFDCCAAPFGADYFFSYWLLRLPRRLTVHHALGLFVAIFLLPALFVQEWGAFKGAIALAASFVALFLLARAGLFYARRSVEDFFLGLSVLGAVWELFFRLPTYFERDTEAVFHTVIHECCVKVLEGLTQTHSLRALTDKERRKPKMRDFFAS